MDECVCAVQCKVVCETQRTLFKGWVYERKRERRERGGGGGTYRGIKGHVSTPCVGLGREAPGANLVGGKVIAVARLSG